MAKTEKPTEAQDAPVKEPGTALVHWKDKMVALTKVTQQAEKPAGGFISFKGGRMTYADELMPGDKLNCIIIDYRIDNEFYPDKYDASRPPVSPACFAIVRPGEPIVPSLDAYQRQGGPVRDEDAGENASCETCWAFEWASSLEGGKGKACKTSRRLHVLASDDCHSPDDIARASFLSMIPPATSVENFSKMMNQVTNVLGTAHFGVEVEISVKPHDKFLFMVYFKVLRQIQDESLLMALMAKYEKISAKEITYPKPDDESPEANAGRANRGSTKY